MLGGLPLAWAGVRAEVRGVDLDQVLADRDDLGLGCVVLGHRLILSRASGAGDPFKGKESTGEAFPDALRCCAPTRGRRDRRLSTGADQFGRLGAGRALL